MNDPVKSKSRTILYALIFIGVATIYILYWWLIPILITASDLNNAWTMRGQFGDMFGAVNALFSAMAFAAIIITMIMQNDTLELQRQDIIITQKEIKTSNEEFEKQNETLKAQRFETSFYNLLATHNNLVQGLSLDNNPTSAYQGKRLLFLINQGLEQQLGRIVIDNIPSRDQILKLRDNYYEALTRYKGVIDMYLESLLYLLELPAYSTLINDDDRINYLRIIAAQLSSNERTIIYYFLCLAINTGEGAYVHQHFHRIQSKFHLFTFITFPAFYNDSHSCLFGWWTHHHDID